MSHPAEVIGPEAELAEAGRMLDRRLGCLPVVDSERLIGIVTTSDILAVHAQATNVAPPPVTVADVMTRAPHTARPEDGLLDAIVRMARTGILHLPVVDDGFHVLGMLSDREAGRLWVSARGAHALPSTGRSPRPEGGGTAPPPVRSPATGMPSWWAAEPAPVAA